MCTGGGAGFGFAGAAAVGAGAGGAAGAAWVVTAVVVAAGGVYDGVV